MEISTLNSPMRGDAEAFRREIEKARKAVERFEKAFHPVEISMHEFLHSKPHRLGERIVSRNGDRVTVLRRKR